MNKKAEGVRKIWDRYKYAVLVVLIGAGLLLLPAGRRAAEAPAEAQVAAEPDLQAALEEILGNIRDRKSVV